MANDPMIFPRINSWKTAASCDWLEITESVGNIPLKPELVALAKFMLRNNYPDSGHAATSADQAGRYDD